MSSASATALAGERSERSQLRAAVRSLRWAATVFLLVLAVGVVMKLVASFAG